METFQSIIRQSREKKKISAKKAALLLEIDSTLLSRYESGERLPPFSFLNKFSEVFDIKSGHLTKYWLAKKVLAQIKDYPEAADALSIVEESMAAYKTAARKALDPSLKKQLKYIDELKSEVRKKKPDATQLKKVKEHFATRYTYDSNRIEGNTLTLQETALVVNEGITISGKSMKEHLEAINHSEALEYINDIAKGNADVSEKMIRELHYLVLKSIDTPNAGVYRSCDVRITGSGHIPASHYEVASQMTELLQYYHKNKKILHPVLLAADMHWMLAGIHPFIDGNGRTSRLLMNLILIRNGYFIANLKGDLQNRLQYYKALEDAQLNLKTGSFRELVVSTVITGLKEYSSLL